MNNANINRQVNCAIYTRKSTDEGLDKEFNSLDAQRDSGEAFIKSQLNEGWTCLANRYDDGGFKCKYERGRIVDLDIDGIRGL